MRRTQVPSRVQLLVACFVASTLSACTGGGGDAFIKSAGWVDVVDSSDRGSLVFDNGALVYSAFGLINRGTLTDAGLEREATVSEAMLDQELGTTYCGEGCEVIEATLTVVRNGNQDTIAYPQGEAPPILSAADSFVTDVMAALEQCLDTSEILPDEDCLKMFTD